MHYFSTAFLADMATRMRAEARYHLARKAIPSASGPVQVGVMRVWCSGYRVQGRSALQPGAQGHSVRIGACAGRPQEG